MAVIAEAESLLGEDIVILKGWLDVVSTARTEGDTQVLDLEIDQLELIGASRFGAVSVLGSSTVDSGGEVRGVDADELFPATVTLDLFLDLDVPTSPLGPLSLTNEAALSLLPADAQTLTSWPPYGILFETPSTSGCVPLSDESAADDGLAICIRRLSMEVAPETPLYSVSRGASRFHPADILSLLPNEAEVGAGQPPFIHASCLELGLSEQGCSSEPEQDNVDALAFGRADVLRAVATVDFSVASGALGVEGSAIADQNLCPPAEPGLSPEPESDVYRSLLDATNSLRFDGNGPVGACESAFPLGLLEAIADRDDLNAFTSYEPTGTAGDALYISLDANSPSLEAFGFTEADVLRVTADGPPQLFAPAGALGLLPGDDLDGLCLQESGDGLYGSSDRLLFSLAPGSPSLAALAAEPGDLLVPGEPRVVHTHSDLGQADNDDLDALSCGAALFGAGGSGDANCDGVTNSIDASLVLQRTAGLLATLPCNDQADVNGGGIDSTDAALILQLEAGLLLELPV